MSLPSHHSVSSRLPNGPVSALSVDALVSLERRCFPDAWSRDALTSLLRNPALRTWGWTDQGEMAAYVLLHETGEEAEILRIGVVPGHRRKGIGVHLLEHVLARAAANGVGRVFLEVRAGNAAALALYRRANFRETARRAGYYRDPAEDALLLEWRAEAPPG
jgi:ribosomal-protein-alanine N-acetyltransferase